MIEELRSQLLHPHFTRWCLLESLGKRRKGIRKRRASEAKRRKVTRLNLKLPKFKDGFSRNYF